MKWTKKDGEFFLHIDGYKNKNGKNVVADFAFCDYRKNIIMYVLYINGDMGELTAYNEDHAKSQIVGLVKAFCRSQIDYYNNIIYQFKQ